MVKSAPDPKVGVYLLYGRDSFLKREFVSTLRRGDAVPSARETDCVQFEASSQDLTALIDYLQNRSFFETEKIGVLDGIDALEADDRSRLLTLAGALRPGSVLVLLSDETNLKKDPFLRQLSDKGRAIACHTPFDKDLPQWIENRFKRSGKAAEREVSYLMIERIGKDTAMLDSAAEQLAVYCAGEPKITLKKAEALLGRSAQADAFKLLDLLIERKLKSALENLESLLREGAKIYEIVGAMASQLDRLNRARLLVEEGFPKESIAQTLKLHPFFADAVINQASRLSRERYRKILSGLLSCDESVKTGRLQDRLALQRFLLGVCAA